MNRRVAILAVVVAWSGATSGRAQTTINLDTVIGSSGTNAGTVAGVGNAVNTTGVATDSGATTLTAVGSTGSSVFDFNSGFADTFDRATGSTASAGLVIADMKHDSGATGPLALDTNNDGSFESVLPGFGLHGDTYVTFDLAVIRTNAALAANTPFTLSGIAGQANWNPYGQTSAAIILDSGQLAVFDWTESGPIYESTLFSLSIAGSARYLTFIALSGRDLNNYGAHVGFANALLTSVPVPEPSTGAALAGLAGLVVAVARRRTARG